MNQDSATPASHEEDSSSNQMESASAQLSEVPASDAQPSDAELSDAQVADAVGENSPADDPAAAKRTRRSAPSSAAPSSAAPSSAAPSSVAKTPRAKANPVDPSAAQLAERRARTWHQDGDALLSIETLRDWINRNGLVLYAPRTQQMTAPAPTLVEATLGVINAAPSVAESETARSLLTRLISEGSAVPLNLMGATGGLGTDVPDYVASAAVFSYIFTLRGNKAWKRAPETQGAVKVSPLASATYEMLAAKVTLSAYDLATQLGKEVTEAAVLRALTELWSQLRVIPVPQTDGSATLWELTTARFTKQIKSGANAGQPSALSALISLYLAQAVLATEDDVETFLSPLAPRSRVRGIVHDLMQARQLETLVIAGKTLLHVGGDLPAFAAAAGSDTAEDSNAETAAPEAGPGSRIAKFTGKPGGKLGTGLRARPFAKPGFADREGKPSFGKKPAFGKKPGFGSKPGFGTRPGFARPAGDRERRPFDRAERSFDRADRPAFTKPAFDKPWNEDKDRKRDSAASAEGATAASEPRTRPDYPARERAGRDARPPRREFAPRESREGGEAPRRTFSKPGTFGRKREGFGAAAAGDSRPPQRDFGGSGGSGDRPERSQSGRPAGKFARPGGFASGGPKRSFSSKPGFGGQGDGGEGHQRPSFQASGSEGEAPRKVYRKFDAPRTKRPFDAARPQRRSDAPRNSDSLRSTDATGGGEGRASYPNRTGGYGARPAGGARAGFGARPEGGERGAGFGPKRPGGFAGKSGGSFSGRSARPEGARPEGARPGGARPGGAGAYAAGPRKPRSFSARPGGSGSGSPRSGGEGGRPSSAGFAAKGGPFAKFADGKKPFRKPGKPSSGKPAGRSSDGGFKPVRRKRPEGGAA